jgi:hypothetical protein
MVDFDLPEGTILIEIRGLYDGWSVAKLPDGSMINRWEPDSHRFKPTQDWIEAFHIGNEG